MAKSTATGIDRKVLVNLAKQVALRVTPPEKISSILYSYDETKEISVEEQNDLLRYVHDTNGEWQKPKGMNSMIVDILNKIEYSHKRGDRYSNSGTATKDEITAIYNWVMNPNRK